MSESLRVEICYSRVVTLWKRYKLVACAFDNSEWN
jgi:hypothetical protein